MAQAVSNLTPFVSFSSGKACNSPRKLRIGCPNFIKATAGNGRDNLDHLQRVRKERQSQSQAQAQPQKRVAPVAPAGLWDRYPTARTVQQMMETMERIMEDPFAYSGAWPSPSFTREGGEYSRGRTPWEIKEGENEYKMRFDMPGMTKDDVKVWVEEKMLIVKAEKVQTEKASSENEKLKEEEQEWSARSYGRYSCRIALPENIQFEKIKAEVKDGVLYITIPKATITRYHLSYDFVDIRHLQLIWLAMET